METAIICLILDRGMGPGVSQLICPGGPWACWLLAVDGIAGSSSFPRHWLGLHPGSAHSLLPASTACEIFPPNVLLRVTSQPSPLCGSGLQSFLEWKGP